MFRSLGFRALRLTGLGLGFSVYGFRVMYTRWGSKSLLANKGMHYIGTV